ncbi:M28 family peptidase [Micromonospora sp. DT81.3]|uniref:M28 family peptidase n=1 Tax=Micromonospora sp. DT81.3 TaxID=3416523 RepID=UPI003CE92CC5
MNPPKKHTRTLTVAASAVAVTALALAPVTAATAAPAQCDIGTAISVKKIATCVAAPGVYEHMQAFQKIADENGGNRAAGLPGYERSVDYVVDTLTKAGWKVTIDEFPYLFNYDPVLTQLTPAETERASGSFVGSAYGDVTGTIIPVDLVLDLPRDPVTSGCETEDFDGLDFSGPADIALVQRGTCEFGVKAFNAETAGAEAVIIMNQGNTPARSDVFTNVTLIGEVTEPRGIPVVSTSFDSGVALAEAGSTARVQIAEPGSRPQKNVIAELPGRNANNIVMAGAHLDSVREGPGINDNGSGSATLLEVAQTFSKLKPQNTIRLAWWGAEEDGLVGSSEYVLGLSQAERDRIGLYLNFDMTGSPNYIYTVYDADQSGFVAPEGVPIPEGSVQIENLFEGYFSTLRVPYDDAEFSGRSDYQAFIEAGIPSGGLFTGAEEPKTEEQAAIWGGTAGEQLDPCYHEACDSIENVSIEALGVNAGAIAVAIGVFSYSTESVNGVRGGYVPSSLRLPTIAGPEGTTNTDGGGGLAPHHDELVAG